MERKSSNMTTSKLPSLKIKTWSEQSLTCLTEKIVQHSALPLILIDGAAGSGKTTLALKLAAELQANLVHTDDVCWYSDPIYWDEEMIQGIIKPRSDGEKVAYRPTGWIKKNREGFIELNPDRALIIEGMGACRKRLRDKADYSIWVDTEPDLARSRVVHRDLAKGENGGTIESVTQFADWWDSLLNPFFLEEEPWKYVDVIIQGSQSDLKSNLLKIHIPQF